MESCMSLSYINKLAEGASKNVEWTFFMKEKCSNYKDYSGFNFSLVFKNTLLSIKTWVFVVNWLQWHYKLWWFSVTPCVINHNFEKMCCSICCNKFFTQVIEFYNIHVRVPRFDSLESGTRHLQLRWGQEPEWSPLGQTDSLDRVPGVNIIKHFCSSLWGKIRYANANKCQVFWVLRDKRSTWHNINTTEGRPWHLFDPNITLTL